MFNDYFDFNIASHFLPALINGDDSGLDNHESNLLDHFADAWQGLKNATWDCLTHHPDLNICDITGLLAATYKVRLHFTNDNNGE